MTEHVIQKKICLLGEFSVGKTSLVRRFVEGRFDEKYHSTIGVKISRKILDRDQHQLNLLIWDLVGGNEFARREASYLLGTAGALIVCDLTRPQTLSVLTHYARQLHSINPQIALVFIGNKVDLTEERAITDEQLTAVCESLGGECLLTSAKTGEQVEAAFIRLADKLEGCL